MVQLISKTYLLLIYVGQDLVNWKPTFSAWKYQGNAGCSEIIRSFVRFPSGELQLMLVK